MREEPRTGVDLVVDAEISISRAERVFRFWLAPEGPGEAPSAGESKGPPKELAERRSGERLEHDPPVRQLPDADPQVRVAAFDQLRAQRR